MNPQPPEYIGTLFATAFVCLVIYHTIKAYYTKSIEPSDLFVLGYVEEAAPQTNNYYVESVKLESQQLFIDCVDALRALGMKKSEATRKARTIFTNGQHNPKTIQEFLLIALQKP
jgi:hypothetical protein